MGSNTNPHDKLWDLIKDIRFGMFTHRHPDGRLHSHPLTTQNQSIDSDATLYFFVSRAGEITQRVAADSVVNIAYADTDDDSYVSISGQASAVEDPAKVKALWSKMAEAWFPGGPTDPDLQLIAVKIQDAEYWDIKDTKVTQLFKMAKAAFTGEPPAKMGDHKELHLS